MVDLCGVVLGEVELPQRDHKEVRARDPQQAQESQQYVYVKERKPVTHQGVRQPVCVDEKEIVDNTFNYV